MAAHPDSPNGCFARHGYRIEKCPNPKGELKWRRIYNPAGEVVLYAVGYDAEMQFCKDNGLLTAASLEEAQIGHPCRPGNAGNL